VHYGLVPRTNRGIFSVNELPDLAERIQVALLNVLEERDIQVRGYTLRLPLDLLLVASANPEDYTNRGRIITPLKDRFGAEVRTHYPLRLEDEVDLVLQEAVLSWPGTDVTVPDHLVEVVARFTRLVRDSPQVDQRSGVSARFAVAAAETVAASAVRRAASPGRPARSPACATCRRWCRRRAARWSSRRPRRGASSRSSPTCCAARPPTPSAPGWPASTSRACRAASPRARPSRPATCARRRPARALGPGAGLAGAAAAARHRAGVARPGRRGAGVRPRGLHLNRRLAKDEVRGRTVYGG
jgi:magnesium chelatase subunit I